MQRWMDAFGVLKIKRHVGKQSGSIDVCSFLFQKTCVCVIVVHRWCDVVQGGCYK